MNATALALLVATVFAPPAKTSDERSTRIYVRTTPPGASIILDGKELGTSDGLFLVPPGVRSITLEMDGYDPAGETVDVKEGWITRVEVRLEQKKGHEPGEASSATKPELLHFVRWVIQDSDTMTFEGQSVTVDELPALIQKVANRAQTVLEVGYSSEISVKMRNDFVGQATMFAQKYGFKHASDIGEQKLGSKGSASEVVGRSAGKTSRSEAQIEQIKRMLARDTRKLDELLVDHGEQHPEVRMLKARIQAWKQSLETPNVEALFDLLDERAAKYLREIESGMVTKSANGGSDAQASRHIAPCTAHIPDADTKDAPVVLDLASGELLKLPPSEGNGDVRHFTKLGKGDMGFDQMLFCLRGGKIEMLENGEAVSIDVHSQKDDAKIYPLAKVPCELLVTTAEERRFQVKVLNKTPDGGLDLEYRELAIEEWAADDSADATAVPVEKKSRKGLSDLDRLRIYDTKLSEAKTQMAVLKTALEVYRLDMGSYPLVQQGLEALLTVPADLADPNHWTGPYLKAKDGAVPEDPWGNAYWYGCDEDGRQFSIRSDGPDGKQNTADDLLLPEPRQESPSTKPSKDTIAYPADQGILEFRVAANADEAKAFAESGEGLGWYESVMKEANGLTTRKQGKQTQILLWQTPEKSMTATAAEKKWRVIEVSIVAEPDKPAKIGVVFDREGGRQLQELTGGNVNRQMAMLVDGRVVSCPLVRAAIGPRVEITGRFSKADLARLTAALQVGMEPSPAP